MNNWLKSASAAFALGFVLVACNSAATTSSNQPDNSSEFKTLSETGEAQGPQVVPAKQVLPSTTVIDVKTGEELDAQTLLPSVKPLLLWFWAPH